MNKSLPAAAGSLPPYESCADQMIGGLYMHDPKTCFHCMMAAHRQAQKPAVRWTFHRHRNIWSYRIGNCAGLSSGEVSDDSHIRNMVGNWMVH